MSDQRWITSVLKDLSARGLERDLKVYPQTGGCIEMEGRSYLNFSYNDYLNLAHNASVVENAHRVLDDSFTTGSCASRLVTGTLSWHQELEHELADFMEYEKALVFGSGYLANLGVISSLVRRGDVVFADRQVHASIVDGVVLSRAKCLRFEHNNIDSLEALLERVVESNDVSGRRLLIVTESVFSMDGDIAPLEEIAQLAKRYGAMLVVDEAHAIGVFGRCGNGIVSQLGLSEEVDVITGSFGKSLGSYGGFAVCSELVWKLFVNCARPFIYNTSVAPSTIGASIASIKVLRKEVGLGEELLRRAELFRNHLAEQGLNTAKSVSQIVPVIVGKSEVALSFSKRLESEGILAIAIRAPTVAENTARLRFSITLAHSESVLRNAADTICACARQERII